MNLLKAGNSGPRVRSDCEVILTPEDSGGIILELNSRVKALFGNSIKAQCTELLNFFGIFNARITVNDSGALPFVIAARIEAAARMIDKDAPPFLPGMNARNLYGTDKERFRLSRLYLPGNTPGLMINAGLHSADGIILDLEDSVAPERKDEARLLVRNALRVIDFCGAERMVRINQGERGLEDLNFLIPHNVNMVLIPKCEEAETVLEVDNAINSIKKNYNLVNPVYLMPIIESALGVEKAFEIAASCGNVAAMAIGLEDYTSDIGVARTEDGRESFYARSRIVNAAKAAGIQPIDSVFSDVADMEALERTVNISRSMGFEGMGCIHPRQVPVIRKGYSPGNEEIEKSQKIISAFEEAKTMGLGVVSLGTKMIDPPVVHRAQRTLDLAVRLGLITEKPIEEDPKNKQKEM